MLATLDLRLKPTENNAKDLSSRDDRCVAPGPCWIDDHIAGLIRFRKVTQI